MGCTIHRVESALGTKALVNPYPPADLSQSVSTKVAWLEGTEMSILGKLGVVRKLSTWTVWNLGQTVGHFTFRCSRVLIPAENLKICMIRMQRLIGSQKVAVVTRDQTFKVLRHLGSHGSSLNMIQVL